MSYLDDDDARAAWSDLSVVDELAASLRLRIDALGACGGRGVVDALIADPEGLRLCAVFFAVVTLGAGWSVET